MSGETPQSVAAPERSGGGERALQLAVAGVALAVLALCFAVEPDPRGVGTHSRIGLPQCSYLARHGMPCPSCGATTSVCWVARGCLARAWSVHSGAAIVGCALGLSIPFSLISALMGWQWLARLRRVSLPAWTALVCVFLALLLVGWPGRVERYRNDRRSAHADAKGEIESNAALLQRAAELGKKLVSD